MKRAFRKPYRIKRRKSIFRNRFFGLGILFFIFIAALFYTLVFLETFQVKKIIITGEGRVPAEDLQSTIESRLEKEILFLKTKSIFLIDVKDIKKDILNNFPQIAEMEIKRGYPDALNVITVERKEIAAWRWQETYFLIDSEGIIFEKCLPETELIKMVDKESTAPINLGEKVIEKDYLEKILETQKKLTEDLKIEVKEFIVFSGQFNAKTPAGWEIYFTPKEDLDWQIAKLSLVLEKEIPPERREDLEHIELRFGNFAPYKYKEKESVDVVNED